MQGTKRYKNDILLILALLLAAGAVWLWLRLTRAPGAAVRVTVDGAVVAVLPLDRDDVYVWEGPEGRNTITVSGGAARVTEADCPDRICVRSGAIRYAGESAVCLPHKLAAEIIGGADGPDAVAR